MFYEIMYRENTGKRSRFKPRKPGKLNFFYMFAPDLSEAEVKALGKRYLGKRFRSVEPIDEDKFFETSPKKEYMDDDYNTIGKRTARKLVKDHNKLLKLGNINKFKKFF